MDDGEQDQAPEEAEEEAMLTDWLCCLPGWLANLLATLAGWLADV